MVLLQAEANLSVRLLEVLVARGTQQHHLEMRTETTSEARRVGGLTLGRLQNLNDQGLGDSPVEV